jgi:spore coat protein U-like protein
MPEAEGKADRRRVTMADPMITQRKFMTTARNTCRGACAKLAAAARAATPLLVAPSFALADTAETNFNVTATVTTACTVAATNLAFGDYVPTAASPTDGTSTVTVRCTLGTIYHVRLNQGLHGTGVTDRKMQRSGELDELAYALYRDATRLLNWGETDETDTVDSLGTGLAVDHTVYGRIAAYQPVPAGAYSDTITVTVSY